MSKPSALPNGHRLQEYEFQRVLCFGEWGFAYLCHDHGLGRAVVVEEYLPEPMAVRSGTAVAPKSPQLKQAFEDALRTFLDDAAALAREGASPVQVRRVFEAGGTGYVVMDHPVGDRSLWPALDDGLSYGQWRQALIESLSEIAEPETVPTEPDAPPADVPVSPAAGGSSLGEKAKPDRVVRVGRFAVRRTRNEAQPAAAPRHSAPRVAARGAILASARMPLRSNAGPAVRAFARPAPQTLRTAARAPLQTQVGGAESIAQPAARTQGWRWAGTALLATGLVALMTWLDTRVLRAPKAGALVEVAEQQTPSPSSSAPVDAMQVDVEGMVADASLGDVIEEVAGRTPEDSGALAQDMDLTPPAIEPSVESGEQSVAPDPPRLVVVTDPEGAEVLVAGNPVGRTPLELTDLGAGVYGIVLRHPYYETVELPGQELADGQVTRVERVLQRGVGSLEVVTEPPGAWIELGGERLAEPTPTTLAELPAGPLELTLGAPGWRTAQVGAEVPQDGVGVLRQVLQRRLGTLTLDLRPPDAQALLPDLDPPEYRPGRRLPEGSHRLVVTRSGYETQARTVDIRGDTQLSLKLTPLAQPFTVAVAPANAVVRFADAELSYSPGMALPPGDYDVEVAFPGYEAWSGTVGHSSGSPTTQQVTLDFVGTEFAETLSSGGVGPVMVMVPHGGFRMGCDSGLDCDDSELPVREIRFENPFALSKYEITFDEYDRFTDAAGLPRAKAGSWNALRRQQPVINVSWNDALAYTQWLSAETGRPYRLPSEAEWEYAARAGSTEAYPWGGDIADGRANCSGCGDRWRARTAPVGSFAANPWGLHDMFGNVTEWVQDCWHGNYQEAPVDGSARTEAECQTRTLRGGSWLNTPAQLRVALRTRGKPETAGPIGGFRVAVGDVPR